MPTLDEALNAALIKRQRQSLYRRRCIIESPQGTQIVCNGRRLTNFSSNDYLGLAGHPVLARALADGAARYGTGSGAAHLVTGHSRPHHTLETALAEYTGRPRALLFSTGYMANLAVAATLLQRGDLVAEDKLNHASLIDGGRLAEARFVRYTHLSVTALDSRLAVGTGRKLVMTDAVFSMDGDIAPLPQLAACARKHAAWLMIDDAHGMGVLGSTGRGTVEHFGMSMGDVPILMATLGKAFGTFGAFVAGSEALIETLIQYARPYIYTTAMPPALAVASLKALELAQTESWRREKLQTLIRRFRKGAAQLGLQLVPSETAIQPLIIGAAETALRYSERLLHKNILVTAIRPPTVPADTARLRITLSASHQQADIDYLLATLHELRPVEA